MAFKDYPHCGQGVELLQRSLERGRLGHGYLFSGGGLGDLELMARQLAKTLNCENPSRSGQGGVAIDCCDTCLTCRKIDDGNHPDVQWARPESKSRIISVDQMRDVMRQINLKPTEAAWKVAVIVAADRLNTSAANAFLKTLEEPPAQSVIILTTTEPERILETIESRCLRLSFGGDGVRRFDAAQIDWLARFSELAAAEQNSLLSRYRLHGLLLQQLGAVRETIEETLAARSPLEKFADAEKDLREKWEDELKAAIESEYRRQRVEWLGLVQWWLRDVWLLTLSIGGEMLSFPGLADSSRVAGRLTPAQAMENLRVIEQTQRLLYTNVQEALAIEVGLLKLNF
jgi:DNA polymerase-3 subunit delta'